MTMLLLLLYHGGSEVTNRTNVLIKPSLHDTYNNSCNYYNYSTKQHVSALFGHHQAYKTVAFLSLMMAE